MLNLENLKGIFGGIAIAMRPDGEFIESDYRADIAKVCSAGVHGIYTTGSTGEWYALDDNEFQWMVDVFLDETSKFDTLTQIGCGGLNTKAVIKRIKIALSGEKKPDGLQITIPPWQILTDAEVVDFFKAVADAADGMPLTHYNTMRSKRFLTEKEYELILKSVPSLIGSKFASSDVDQIIGVTRSGLPMNFFAGSEWCAVPMAILGSKGVYSEQAMLWPEGCVELLNLCEQKRWDEALVLQEKFIGFRLEGTVPLMKKRQYCDAAWDKGIAEAAGFIKCKRYIRPPHHCMLEEDIQHARAAVKKYYPC